MKSPAIIVAFTIVGSLAFAAGQARVVPPQSPDQPSLPPMSGGKQGGTDGEGGVAGQASNEMQCTQFEGTPLNWFTAFHVVPLTNQPCTMWLDGLSGWGSGGPEGDIDRNGSLDRLRAIKIDGDGSARPADSSLTKPDVLSGGTIVRWSSSVVDGELVITRQSVVSTDLLQQVLCADVSCVGCNCDQWLNLNGLLDVDGDGDLDIVLTLHGGQGRVVWLENTAVVDNNLAADINEDGVVDGKDLASVLAAWTP